VDGHNLTFWAPLHPVRLRCKTSENPDIPAASGLPANFPTDIGKYF
jgi:hypothetical protein